MDLYLILYLYHIPYTTYPTSYTLHSRVKQYRTRYIGGYCTKGPMPNTHIALALNNMNATVQGQIHRDPSPAGMDQDKRKRKIGVSISVVVMCRTNERQRNVGHIDI